MIEDDIRVLRLAKRIKAITSMAFDSSPDNLEQGDYMEVMLMLTEAATEIEKIMKKNIDKASMKPAK
ncbi:MULTISPECIES: hypothetical protein [Vibrio]|uniref:Uncharacterized protein n=2 Tax=Vibrio TaxID=662 RepID=A0A7U6J4K9_VIBAN|nr:MULTISPECIES: hypothetical protein [Vibrio]AZS27497.1 hypothetical protein DYL72_21535 [Vibrio anguillarum]AZS27516.1 hypothetical protein DYL72_21635 [Vibrio anguillarum]AZS27537.1 hypothetical protein DYL72_21750 [Vibrio anguillarum]AZS27552.1 hypothetical protein DYL72_21835 [Vibrio anguillarum]OEE73429.1 hypothetical protein A147_01020 [Vibrio splendidus FF-6]